MGRDAETGRKAADKGDMTGLFGLFQDAARDAVLGAGLPPRGRRVAAELSRKIHIDGHRRPLP